MTNSNTCNTSVPANSGEYGELDKARQHLSHMEGAFGRCIQGYHSALQQWPVTSNLIGSCIEEDHTEFTQVSACITQAYMSTIDKFIQSEEMVAEVQPHCSSCIIMWKVPYPRTNLLIQGTAGTRGITLRNNLIYKEKEKVWMTTYPWLVHPKQLPNNYKAVMATRDYKHYKRKGMNGLIFTADRLLKTC